MLLTHHNLTYYQRLLAEARKAIEEDRFLQFFETRMAVWSAPAASDNYSPPKE